jgi:hypothetical protein
MAVQVTPARHKNSISPRSEVDAMVHKVGLCGWPAIFTRLEQAGHDRQTLRRWWNNEYAVFL